MKLTRRRFLRNSGLTLPFIPKILGIGFFASACNKNEDIDSGEDEDDSETNSIPDKSGMNIKGLVACDGAGVSGVVVSDGIEVTTTDDDGIYYLNSEKENGYVFVSVPGNYKVDKDSNYIPQFFKSVSSKYSIDRRDFELTVEDNEKHVVLMTADWHLANRCDDLDQYTDNVLPDIKETIGAYQNEGINVYALALGDLAWDTFWYKNDFGLNEYLTYMKKMEIPVFNVIGNHDNDPYCEGDLESEAEYKEVVGPSYYSFNLGSIHYIVLDDIEFLNTGASEGSFGERNYNDVVVSDQLEWLKKDLETITDKNTPIVVALHVPVYKNPALDNDGNQINRIAIDNGDELIACFDEFSNVHIWSGHAHNNRNMDLGNVMEHTVSSLCATWWWTGRDGYAGNHISKDGSVGGYGVWEIDGTTEQWHYKSIDYEKDYQFRTYDLNTVHITAENFAPNSDDETLAEYAYQYADKNENNEVLINIWNYDTEWTIEVTENGQSLDVERLKTYDPLHIISYEAMRLNKGATPTEGYLTMKNAHMFKVTASSATSTLEIKVTDRFGNEYTETMTRPKTFYLGMK